MVNQLSLSAVEQLRQVVIELRMIPLKDEANIQNVWASFNEDGSIVNKHATFQLGTVISAIIKACSSNS